MKILHKYVLKEHVGPLVFSLSTLTSLLLLNYIARRIGDLVGKGLPWDVIGKFFVLTIPFTVAMTLPMAVLVSTLFAFSRLASENEVTGMKASGVSLARLLVPVLCGGVVVAGIMLWFNDQVLPQANHQLQILQTDIVQKKPTFLLHEQQMNEVSQGRLFLRTQQIDQSTGRLSQVQIYDISDAAVRRTIFADSGTIALTANMSDLILTLYDGEMFEVSRVRPADLRHMYFKMNRMQVRGVGNQLQRTDSSAYRSDRERTICDMQRELEAAEFQMHTAEALLVKNPGIDVPAARTQPPTTKTAADGSVYFVRPFRLGHAYCSMLGWLDSRLHTKTAEAAQAGSGGQGAPGQAAVVKPESVKAAAAQPAPVPTPTFKGPAMSLGANLGAAMSDMPAAAAPAIIQDAKLRMARYGVEIHKKFALAAACVVFLLVGAPVALRFPRGGVGLVIGVSIVVFGIYYVGLIGGESLANNLWVSPFWAMWAPNIILTMIGGYLLARMGRESATTRGGDFSEITDRIRGLFRRSRDGETPAASPSQAS